MKYNNRLLTKADLVDAVAPLQKELDQHERKMNIIERH